MTSRCAFSSAEKKQATKETADKKEGDAEGQNFPLSVQQDIVKKEKAKARQGMEEAIEEAKVGLCCHNLHCSHLVPCGTAARYGTAFYCPLPSLLP